jgi:hypothetical protein
LRKPAENDGGKLLAAGHDIRVPFFIGIQTTDQCVELTCRKISRNLPGKRLVCDGSYADQPIVVKIFLEPWRAEKHACREKHGQRSKNHHGLCLHDATVF